MHLAQNTEKPEEAIWWICRSHELASWAKNAETTHMRTKAPVFYANFRA